MKIAKIANGNLVSIFSGVSCRWPALLILCAGLLSLPAYGAAWSWSGGGGANANWNNSANWGFAGIPGNGDTVIFPNSQPNELNTNNISGLILNQIRFVGAGGGYDIRGNAFTLTNSIVATNTAGANTIENLITLATANVLIVVSNGVSLTLEGNLSGSVGVTKAGLGTLLYQCSGDNTYSGTTLVAGGTLQFNVSGVNAVSGPLVIGDGTGANSPTVEDLQPEEMNNLPSVTINLDGTLNLNNYVEPEFSPNLTLSGGTIETGTGTLILSANGIITVTTDTSTISGNFNTGSGTLTLQGNGYLDFFAIVSGSANIVQNATVSTAWYAANTYTGSYTDNSSGYVALINSLALGNTNNAMTLNGQAWVALDDNINITNQSLTINSTNLSATWSDYGTIYDYGTTTNSWTASFTNNSANTTIDILTNCGFNLDGPMAGSGGFSNIGVGTLTLSGTTANTYAGSTTMSGGTLLLDKPYATISVPGPLFIGSNTIVRLLSGFQINNPATPVTMSDTSLFDLNGNSEWVGPISLQGAQITTEAGILYLDGNITVNGSLVAQSVISGNAEIWDGTYTITSVGHEYSPDLLISANVSSGGGGGGGLIKAGAGEVGLAGNNSFIGPVTINGGDVFALTSTALGSSTNAAVTVNSGGTLFLDGTGLDFGLKPLVLNGGGYAFGALSCSGGSSWEGSVTLGSASTIDTYGGSSLTLAGAVSGTGGVTGAGSGTLTFAGAAANTYTGTTTVSGGTLLLDKSASIAAVPGNLVVNSSATVRLANSQQMVNSADVLVNSGALFDFSTLYTYIDTLRGSGTVNFGVGGWIYIGLNNGSSEFDGSFTGTGYYSGWTVGKTGTGTFTIGGNSSYTAGITHVLAGNVFINGSQPLIPVTVDLGATLGGSGTVGAITANGIIYPGVSPVILNSSNVTFSASGNFTVELTGPNPGAGGYDQLNVNGTVSLASATLTLVPAFTTPVAIGQQFIILNNNGAAAITGTFTGLPEGTLFSVGGYTFRISYVGGTGNDVVLTLWGMPGNTVTVNAVDEGWYNSSGSSDTENYFAGANASDTNIYRNWLVFDVPVFSGSIIHAELLINTYEDASPTGDETYLLRKVTTPVATLEAGGSSIGIYNDLGTNAVYAIRSVATNESEMTAIIPLNVQFFNDAAAASGSQIALGGSIATLEPTNNLNQYLFGFSDAQPGDIQLRLTFGTSVVINSASRGWYDSTGLHDAANVNYVAGVQSGEFWHNYFTFNLPAITSQLADAQLLLNSYDNVSPYGVETYQLNDVTNSISVLTNNASGATNIYADLGNGTVYGGRSVYVSESGLISSIPLNGNFLAATLANSGGAIALGGALTSLTPASTDEYLFGLSGNGVPADAQLWLGFLDVPASPPSFVDGTAAYLGNNRFRFVISGTTGTTNEIQGSFDFQRWDFINDVIMTGSDTSFIYTNNTSALPYRFFRAEQLQ